MKIEKLTENKIRVILKQDDFKDKNIDIKKIFLSSEDSQNLFLEILAKAKKEFNFNTDGHKLLIEAFFQNDDVFVFTITKYIESYNPATTNRKRYLTIKKKSSLPANPCYIYQFADFEDFCKFCDFIDSDKNIVLRGLFKTSILYNYNNTYYLIIENINISHKSANSFHSSLLEFSNFLPYSKNFNFKLREHGKVIMKNNAINTAIKYFANK